MDQISPGEANKRIANENLLIIDVREQFEIDVSAISNFIHIPMNEIPARLGEIPKDKQVAFLCHSGGRSGKVTMYLMQQGFSNVINIQGGIDLWSRSVDSSVPRYKKAFGQAQVII